MAEYSLGIKKGLLDQKHMDAMGNAVWLFMWLVDKQTKSTGIVLGGQPITWEIVNSDFTMPIRTYRRYISILTETQYIATKRTPRGLVITINKQKKLRSDVPEMAYHDVPNLAYQSKSDVPNIVRDVPKSVTRSDKSGTSNIRLTKTNKDSQVSTVVDKPASFGKPDINEMFDYWHEAIGYKITSRIQANRNACSNLLKKHGKDVVIKMVNGVSVANEDKYAPRISDFTQLQQKWHDLMLWGNSRKNRSTLGVIS